MFYGDTSHKLLKTRGLYCSDVRIDFAESSMSGFKCFVLAYFDSLYFVCSLNKKFLFFYPILMTNVLYFFMNRRCIS